MQSREYVPAQGRNLRSPPHTYRKSAGARREDNGTALAGIAGQARTAGERMALDVTRKEVAADDAGILIGWSWSADCVCKPTWTAAT